MSSNADGAPDFTPVSPEERIKELNAVDHDIAQILSLASKAIGPLANDDYEQPNPRLDDVKETIEEAYAKFYATLSSIDVHMRRQTYALEEAGLINKGTRQDADRATSMNEDQTSRRAGGGSLDSSWLNARAKDSIGQGLKREALDEAKEFLRKSGIQTEGAKDDAMQVDMGKG
ncbi:hypothetical protein PMZ80_006381 [Knufia obscura]|uniref:Mediator of RNA polymerase II transcription subunit 11 n=2 Tax=Knufia TaxID=430999 RepID=A0AAN8EW35_9EURO|nr:hypothetical protein PMZ80_006381 [Knufia obscura]KAK5953473.1 hypothetical protein OHC33_005417 [Knufia fluminis]